MRVCVKRVCGVSRSSTVDIGLQLLSRKLSIALLVQCSGNVHVPEINNKKTCTRRVRGVYEACMRRV